MKQITPCLWFDDNAEDAAKFYTSIFKNSRIKHIARYDEATAAASGQPKGSVLTVLFELHGQEFMGLNGGPMFKFNEAVSFMIMCDNQEEVDRYWNALSGPGSGGQESQCGWLKDRFGVSWQIVPTALGDMMKTGTDEQRERVMKAVLAMIKLDVATLKAAFEGK